MTKISENNVLFDNTTLTNLDGTLTQIEGTDGKGAGIERRLSKTTGINALNPTLQVPLFEATDHDYAITKAVVRLSSISNFSNEGSVSMGISEPDLAEVYPETKLEGLTSTNRMFTFSSALGSQTILAQGQSIIFDIDQVYTADEATLEVDLFGYQISG